VLCPCCYPPPKRSRDSCLNVEIRGLHPIHAAKSICGGTNSIYKENYIYLFNFFRYKRSAPKQGMVGASNFHLLRVGAEKSSLYRLGLLGFDAYLILRERGRFDKGAFKPFCWIVGPQPRPIE
jgi:hypothetical protein